VSAAHSKKGNFVVYRGGEERLLSFDVYLRFCEVDETVYLLLMPLFFVLLSPVFLRVKKKFCISVQYICSLVINEKVKNVE